MIVRTWHATATEEGAEAYWRHFMDAVLPELESLPGFRGAYLLRREADGGVGLQAVTLWESLDAIRGFAGADLETAVVEPEARAVLTRFDAMVTHYDAIVAPPP